MSSTLRVDVWSDVVCPWCYIGQRRLEEAVRRHGADVEVVHHAFLLSPETTPESDGGVAEHLAAHKGLPADQVGAMLDRVTAIAAGEGLVYDFDATRHTSTLPAHEVIRLALERGAQGAMVERLFRAYFTEGRHIGRTEELAALAAEVGLDPDEVRAALADHRWAAAVQEDLAQARAYGISGVPFFVVDGRYGVSGAQDAGVLEQALGRAAADRAATASDAAVSGARA